MSKKTINIENRLAFLAKQFDVFDISEDFDTVIDEYTVAGYEEVVNVSDPLTGNVIALVSERYRNEDSFKIVRKCSVEITVFSSMLSADPTDNKMFLQWLLSVYTSMLRSGDINGAIRFACEDLPIAKEYLELFEQNKKKQRFHQLCSSNFNLSEIKDYSNINQYKSLSKLYDAVDPFIEKDYSGLKANIMRYVNVNEAEITYKSRYFTVYVPKTRNSMVIFDKFVSWCTAKPENGMFRHYTNTFLTPKKQHSKLYVVIPSTFFEGTTNDLYHVHFESDQFHNKGNASVDPKSILSNDIGLRDYFGSELIKHVSIPNIEQSSIKKYVTQADKLGIGYLVFYMMDVNLTNIRLINKQLSMVPKDISRYRDLIHLALIDSQINSIDDSLCDLKNLRVLSLNDNPVKKLPENMNKLKSLEYLSICNTGITDLPNSIAELGLDSGGSLKYIAISDDNLTSKINKLLPNVKIILNKPKKNGKISTYN